MSAAWLYPLILVAGILQAIGAPMNAQLRQSLTNPWMASAVSFGLILALFACLSVILPRPLPTAQGLQSMPWWAPLGGLAGSLAVALGLFFVDRIGAGPFNGLVITANILASLAVDHFGLLGMPDHAINVWRVLGGLLMMGGIVLIAVF